MASYDLPFVDWISIGLNRESLTKTVETINSGRSLNEIAGKYTKNRAYINKLLREEVFKQFDDRKRPALEVILNSIDARPQDQKEDYQVKINYGWNSFEVKDKGTGMTLVDILTHLTIPFSTKKNGIDEIGRFGVGFLSTFNYCLARPKRVHVRVKTATGEEGYSIDFYSTSSDIEGLRMAIKKQRIKSKKGTVVRINRYMGDKEVFNEYLSSNLRNIPSPTAQIFLQNKRINGDKDSVWYASGVEFDLGDRTITQRVGFVTMVPKNNAQIEMNERIGKVPEIHLTSQGVLVKKFLSYRNRDARVYLPSGVKVVEGRDEFKIDGNYKKAVAGVFAAFEDFVKRQPRTDALLEEMAGFIPSLASALSINNITEIPNIDSLRNGLFTGKKYILDLFQKNRLEQFLGDNIKMAFVAETAACSYWREIYGSGENLFEDSFKKIRAERGLDVKHMMIMEPDFCPNLMPLMDVFKEYRAVTFGEVNQDSKSAFLIEGEKDNKIIHINLKHKSIRGLYSAPKAFATLTDYYTTAAFSGVQAYYTLESAEKEIQNNLDKLYLPALINRAKFEEAIIQKAEQEKNKRQTK